MLETVVFARDTGLHGKQDPKTASSWSCGGADCSATRTGSLRTPASRRRAPIGGQYFCQFRRARFRGGPLRTNSIFCSDPRRPFLSCAAGHRQRQLTQLKAERAPSHVAANQRQPAPVRSHPHTISRKCGEDVARIGGGHALGLTRSSLVTFLRTPANAAQHDAIRKLMLMS